MAIPQQLEDLISSTALPVLQQYNDLEAKQPVTEYTVTNQIRIAMPKPGQEVDQSCFEQLWVATARDGTTLSSWRPVPTQEALLAKNSNVS
jgi:hypothetical protein